MNSLKESDMSSVKFPDILILLFLAILAPCYFANVLPPSQWAHGVNIGDAQLNFWALIWQWNVIPGNIPGIWDGNAFYPSPDSITGSEHLFSQMLLGYPVYLLTRNPFLAYHFIIFFSLALGAWGIFFLVRYLLDKSVPALLSAVYFTVAFPRSIHLLTHIQVISFQWLPWSLLALLKYRTGGKMRWLLLFVVSTTLQILSSWYLAFLQGLMLMVMIPTVFFNKNSTKQFVFLMLAGIVVSVLIFPFMAPYLDRQETVTPNQGIVGVHWKDYLNPPFETIWGRLAGEPVLLSERSVFPGFLIVLMVMTGIFFKKQTPLKSSRFFLGITLAGILGLVLSFGPGSDGSLFHQISPYRLLSKIFTPLNQIRAPARFSQLVVFSLSVMGGWGLFCCMATFGKRRIVSIVSFIIIGLVLVEQFPLYRIEPFFFKMPDVYQWVAQQEPDTVIAEIPAFYGTDLWGFTADYMMYAAMHGKQIVNGYSRYVPSGYSERAGWMREFPSHDSINRLRKLGVDFVILHPQRYFHEHHRRIFADMAKDKDLIKAYNLLTKLAMDNYRELRSDEGVRVTERAKMNPDLQSIEQFDCDIVFRLTPHTQTSRNQPAQMLHQAP